jgi:hypothetical protein
LHGAIKPPQPGAEAVLDAELFGANGHGFMGDRTMSVRRAGP